MPPGEIWSPGGVFCLLLAKQGPSAPIWQGTTSGGNFPNYCILPTRAHVVSIVFPVGKVYRFQPRVVPECQALVPQQVVRIEYVPLAGYDGEGDLFRVTGLTNEVTSYTYLEDHYLHQIRDATGQTMSAQEYDGDGRLVKSCGAGASCLDSRTHLARDHLPFHGGPGRAR